MKKRIIAVIGTVLLTTLFLNGSNTEAVIKPPVIFVGNENVTGGKYIIGQKSKLMLNIKNKKQYKKISFRTKNLKKVKVDQKGTVTAGTSGGKGVIIVTGITKEGKMKAVVSITIDDEFVVHDIKVIEGEKGLFIAMPSKKAIDGEYRDIAHPINSGTREKIQTIILKQYEQAMAEAEVEEAAAEA